MTQELTLTPLTSAQFGQTVTIRKVNGDLKFRQHLADLGCVLDAKVTVINQLEGDLILKIQGTRVALGQAMAQQIYY